MQKVAELLRCSHWSLLLQNPKTQELYFEIAIGPAAEKLRHLKLKPGEGIAGTAFSSGMPQRVDNVSMCSNFAQRFDAMSEFQTGSILAVPLKSKGKVLGVIELVSAPGARGFNDEDFALASGIADFAAIALENAKNFQRVQELTLVDEHTTLFNVRHMRDLLEREVERARRFNHPLSLLFLDLDHFKQVNDTHGHLVGSALLRDVGLVLKEAVREVDTAFRYGGDEFAVLLPETGAQDARSAAERIRQCLTRHSFDMGRGLQLQLTVSVGSATYPEHATDAVGLIDAADRAMYRVKSEGRNGVCSAAELVRSAAAE